MKPHFNLCFFELDPMEIHDIKIDNNEEEEEG